MKKQPSAAPAKKTTASATRKATAKPAAKKTTVQKPAKPAAKSASSQKPAAPGKKPAAAKPVPVKAAPSRKPAAAVKSAPVKAVPGKKPAAAVKPAPVKAAPSKKPIVPAKSSPKTTAVVKPSKSSKEKQRFGVSDLDFFRQELLAKRDLLTGQTSAMRRNALERTDEDNVEEDGTDSFNRLFALEQAGTQQHQITSIDEALRAIDKGHYGVCVGCGELIGKARLTALPFAATCIVCAQANEKNRAAGRHF